MNCEAGHFDFILGNYQAYPSVMCENFYASMW